MQPPVCSVSSVHNSLQHQHGSERRAGIADAHAQHMTDRITRQCALSAVAASGPQHSRAVGGLEQQLAHTDTGMVPYLDRPHSGALSAQCKCLVRTKTVHEYEHPKPVGKQSNYLLVRQQKGREGPWHPTERAFLLDGEGGGCLQR